MKPYDLAVTGSGTAAMVAAMRVRAAGWSVAVIDHRPFGGTCALRGCDPKKMLVGGAAALDHAHRMRGKGIAGDARIDWADLMAFKRSFTDPVPAKHEAMYARKGIDAYHGRARFTGRNMLDVDGTAIEARYILLAVGAEPVRLGIPGEEHLVTSEQFLELGALPERIVLVGGGYIAAEFSHIAARAGAQVTILQRAPRLLTHFDPDCVGWLMEVFSRWGIDVRTRTTARAIERRGSAFLVRAESEGRRSEIEADLVVHAAGRAPALEELDLNAGGVRHEKGRLELNEYLQSTSNAAVYAAGDAAQVGPPLTPVSSLDAKVAAANILRGNHTKPDYRGVPSVAFSIPPIAAVGLSEEKARSEGLRIRMNSGKASDWFTARQAAEPVYGYKVLIEEKSERILGAHLVGPHADEVINLFALAMRRGLNAEDLRTTMFAYPTGASDIGYMLG
ncbi:MAG TPA: NAD(P)/FAD-dependent oxidoreductase [Burkholderiales bacterium]